jgi:uncharacterized protein YndB with AHSA1/START domain
MSDFTIDIDVNAPQQTVFEYLADGTRTPEWYEAVRSAVKTSEGSTGRDTRFTFTRVLPQGEVANEVEISEFREPERSRLRGTPPERYPPRVGGQ